ncbi:MAG: helix-turn-helix transcriptional regulator [Treponema sp.]|nr:helix-turn-helix transcriptional regulator [Treponema sp.]
MDECTEFWERVNKLIKQLHTKQETVASDCGINYQTFRGWIVHKTYPNAKQSVLIANCLGTTVEYLVTGKEILDEDFKEAYKAELLRTLTNVLN